MLGRKLKRMGKKAAQRLALLWASLPLTTPLLELACHQTLGRGEAKAQSPSTLPRLIQSWFFPIQVLTASRPLASMESASPVQNCKGMSERIFFLKKKEKGE